MLGIPFLTAEVIIKRKRSEPDTRIQPVPRDIVRQAEDAVRERKPSKALALTIPFQTREDAPDRIRLVAGKALMAMGRYPEAVTHLEEYVRLNPESVEGLVTVGLAAARMREVARALDWFRKASEAVTGQARKILQPILENGALDLIDIEDMVADCESHPNDKDRALALACVLGRLGHFRAVERFIPILDW